MDECFICVFVHLSIRLSTTICVISISKGCYIIIFILFLLSYIRTYLNYVCMYILLVFLSRDLHSCAYSCLGLYVCIHFGSVCVFAYMYPCIFVYMYVVKALIGTNIKLRRMTKASESRMRNCKREKRAAT